MRWLTRILLVLWLMALSAGLVYNISRVRSLTAGFRLLSSLVVWLHTGTTTAPSTT